MNPLLIGALIAGLISGPARASRSVEREGEREAYRIARQIEDDLPRSLQAAMSTMMLVAEANLRIRGEDELADRLRAEWEGWAKDQVYLAAWEFNGALGDHKPLSIWLAEWYGRLEAALGAPAMAFLHLDDLNVINFAVPVVRDPRMESGDWQGPEPRDEYQEHFVPLGGVISFWLAYSGCCAATWGTGFVFFCTPVGMVAEHVMIVYIAPGLSDRVYDRANQGGDYAHGD
jgi:hypothetical protein